MHAYMHATSSDLLDLANLLGDGVQVLEALVQLISHSSPLSVQRDDIIDLGDIGESTPLRLSDDFWIATLVCEEIKENTGVAAEKDDWAAII